MRRMRRMMMMVMVMLEDGDDDARGCASEGERCEGGDMREEGVEYKRRTGDGEGGSKKG